jgi:DNA-binding CsgD family transcriptional regulator
MRKKASKPAESIFDPTVTSYAKHREMLVQYMATCGPKTARKERMDALLEIAFCYSIVGMIKEAETALQECEPYILQHGKPEQKACVYHIHSRLGLHHSRYEEGLAYGIRSLHLFRTLPFHYFTRIAATLCGHLCAGLNLFTEAIDYLSEAYTTAVQMHDRKGALYCKANLNDLRLNVFSTEDCIHYNLDLLKEIKAEPDGAPSPLLMGTCLQLTHLHLKLNKVKQAEMYVEQASAEAQRLAGQLPPHYFLFTNLYGLKAAIAARHGKEKEMLQYADECSTRGRQAGKVVPEIDVTFTCFKFYIDKKNINKAKKLLDHACSLIPEGDKNSFYVETLENKCLYYRAKKDVAAEYKHFKLIHEYKMKTHEQALKHRNNYLSLMHDLEVKKKEIETQKSEINSKTLELNMSLYHLEQRNQLLTDIKNELTTLKKTKPKSEVVFKTIFKTINNAFTVEEEKKKHVREKFDETQRSFIAALHQQYPTLSTTECRVCALLRWSFNTKEISSFLSTNTRTIENHRTNIRRKLKLQPGQTLGLVLNSVE